MKIRKIIKIIAVFVLILNFSAGGLVGFQSLAPIDGIALETVSDSGEIQNGLDAGSPPTREASILSNATLLSLLLAVLGIVAFRRNSYN